MRQIKDLGYKYDSDKEDKCIDLAGKVAELVGKYEDMAEAGYYILITPIYEHRFNNPNVLTPIGKIIYKDKAGLIVEERIKRNLLDVTIYTGTKYTFRRIEAILNHAFLRSYCPNRSL